MTSTEEPTSTAASELAKRRTSKRVATAHAQIRRGVKDERKRRYKPNGMVDFDKLEMSSLLRYKRFFKLPVRQNATKSELVVTISKHFQNHPRLRDQEVISAFLFANNRYLDEMGN